MKRGKMLSKELYEKWYSGKEKIFGWNIGRPHSSLMEILDKYLLKAGRVLVPSCGGLSLQKSNGFRQLFLSNSRNKSFLTVENREAIVLVRCKKLVHFGAPPISGAKQFDKQCRKSLYYRDLSKERP